MDTLQRPLTQFLWQISTQGKMFWKPKWWVAALILSAWMESICVDGKGLATYTAIVNITYKHPTTGQVTTEKEETGLYGQASHLDSDKGWVVHIRTADNQTHGCTPPQNVPAKDNWIALVQRGECKFSKKIHNAAVIKNASAVVIYNNKDEELLSMDHNVWDRMLEEVENVVSIFMKKDQGERIARLVDNGTKVFMRISVGRQIDHQFSNINKTSVLFVSISFIVLMIISLAWLVFYYIQRFRYAHAKERLSKRLMNAAKKAITKMPLRTIRSGDRETESDFDQCAVCIESYRVSDVLRILPCKHTFHKSCVDPWLIEQRSCPMCKMDILKAYGLQVHGSRDSVNNVELEGISTSALASDQAQLGSLGLDDSITNGAVEIVHYQPAQVEYHETPAQIVATTDLQQQADETAPADEAACPLYTESMESVHSNDSESNELQKLMPASARRDSVDGASDPVDT